jgi:hypothetical protein
MNKNTEEWEKVLMDMLVWGTGVAKFNSDGTIQHIPYPYEFLPER